MREENSTLESCKRGVHRSRELGAESGKSLEAQKAKANGDEECKRRERKKNGEQL